MTKKIIPFEISLKSTKRAGFTFQPRPQILTNDANAAELNFIITDTSTEELAGSTATVLLFMKDGSFFQNTDVTRFNNIFSYVIKPNQAKHKGVAQVQLVVKNGSVENASPLMEVDIVGGLESKPIVEREIQDWTSLTAEAKAFVEQIEGFTLESFVENKMGEELANLETNYATRLTGLETADQNLTAQLAQKVGLGKKAELEDLSPSVLSAIEGGEGTTFNLLSIPQDKSVTWGKTTFMEIGKNLFNINDMKEGYGLNSIGIEVVNEINGISDYIECRSGDVIAISYGDVTNRTVLTSVRLVVYDSNFNMLEVLSSFASGDTINIPDARYFRASITLSIANINFQIEKGSVTDYEEYYISFTDEVRLPTSDDSGSITDDDLKNWVVSPEQTTFIGVGKNKFNPLAVKNDYTLSSSGEEVPNAINCISDYIRVTDGTVVRYSTGGTEFSARTVLYNSNYEKIHTYSMFESGSTINHPDVAFFRVSVTKVVANLQMQIEFGELTPYEPFNILIDDEIKVKASNIIEGGVGSRLKGKTVVFFGDSITQDSRERSHYPTYFEALTGARSINQGYGGTTMTRHVLDEFRPFSMTYMLQAKLSGDYTEQEAVITAWAAGTADEQLRASNYTLQLDKFKALDFNNVYAITMLYGANDHGGYIGTVDDVDPEGATFTGAYNHVIKTLQENYPDLGIILISPIYREFSDPSTENRTELFVEATKEVARANNLPCYDAYHNLGFNKYNFRQYYSNDGLHPIIEIGQPRMGERISAWLNSVI